MVKSADLGIPSSNLEEIPSKEKRKKVNLERAVTNLARTEPPERLKRSTLPESLLKYRSG